MYSKSANRFFLIFELLMILISVFCWVNFLSKNINRSSETEQKGMQDSFFEYSEFDIVWNNSFPQRIMLSKIDSIATFCICREIGLSSIIEGQEGWLFYSNTLSDYTGEYYYSEEELESIVVSIQEIENYFDERDISFVMTIIPNKNSVYSEYMPNMYSHVEPSRTDILVEYMCENGINIIYPKELLLELHTDYPLYYRYDTHWNQLGAYVAVYNILNEWNIFMPSLLESTISSFPLSDNYHSSADVDLARMAGVRFILNNEIEYVIDGSYSVDWELYENEANSNITSHIVNSEAANKKTIVLIGDSFRASMLPALCNVFSDVYVMALSRYSEDTLNEISNINPDYVIMEFVEREAWSYLPLLLEMGVP